MPIYATSGAHIYIGGVLPAKLTPFVEADFNTQSWVEIGWWENAGAFGDAASEITFDAIAQERTFKLKGNRNAGNQELMFAIDPADAGQIAVRAAEQTEHDYAFRVLFNDAPVGGDPSERLYIAKVMSARDQLDNANSVMRLAVTLGINSNVVVVNAAP